MNAGSAGPAIEAYFVEPQGANTVYSEGAASAAQALGAVENSAVLLAGAGSAAAAIDDVAAALDAFAAAVAGAVAAETAGATLDAAAEAVAITAAAASASGLMDHAAALLTEAVAAAEAAGAKTGPGGGGASAADIWAYELAPGVTAGQMLLEIWRIHGLDAANPLVVTQTARTTDAIDQTITDVAGTITVSRQ